MKVAIIIPARMASTRFPGKPLADLMGKPVIQWVYERACEAGSASRVLVATCDEVIAEAVAKFGGEVAMTSDRHLSGTDRVAEAAAKLDVSVVVNLQGDEPLVEPRSIDRAVHALAEDERASMSSLMVGIDAQSAQDENLVKVVVDNEGFAMYFSRSPIPFQRNPLEDRSIYGHIGLYAYRRDFLMRFTSLAPSPLEKAESLEQLRALEYGFHIKMVEVSERPMGIDTPDDLERVRRILAVSQTSGFDRANRQT